MSLAGTQTLVVETSLVFRSMQVSAAREASGVLVGWDSIPTRDVGWDSIPTRDVGWDSIPTRDVDWDSISTHYVRSN